MFLTGNQGCKYGCPVDNKGRGCGCFLWVSRDSFVDVSYGQHEMDVDLDVSYR